MLYSGKLPHFVKKLTQYFTQVKCYSGKGTKFVSYLTNALLYLSKAAKFVKELTQ